MTNAELADEIEWIGLVRFCHETGMEFTDAQQQIIAALRQSSDKVLVSRGVLEDIYSLAACDNHCGRNDCPFCSIGNEIRARLNASAEAEGHHE